jgi:sugar lactone lactonase YvrE
VWVAVWGGAQVRRYSAGGRLLAIVPMPVSQPSSGAFADDGTLYITSARAGLDPSALAAQPHAGSKFALPTGCAGVPVAPFEN